MSAPSRTAMQFSAVNVNRHFGFDLVSRSSEEARVSMTPSHEFIQEHGVIHGGVLSTLADTTAVYCFHPDLEAGQAMTSIEFKMNFLRPALPDRGKVTAHAKVVRRGKKVGLCEVDLFQSDALVAKGLFTYMFYERE